MSKLWERISSLTKKLFPGTSYMMNNCIIWGIKRVFSWRKISGMKKFMTEIYIIFLYCAAVVIKCEE